MQVENRAPGRLNRRRSGRCPDRGSTQLKARGRVTERELAQAPDGLASIDRYDNTAHVRRLITG